MSPGYLPFAGALDLPAFFCDNCGFWQRHFEAPPACPLCLDARHVVPQAGWSFRTLAEAQALYPCHWEELEPGLWRFWNEPVSGIGSMSYLLQGAAGNMMFEGCAAFSPGRWPSSRSSAACRCWQPPIPTATARSGRSRTGSTPNSRSIPATSPGRRALCVTWPFDALLEPLPGLELHLTAGHFDGHTVLYDRGGRSCSAATR